MKHKLISILCLLGCTFGAATAQNIVHPKIAGPNGLWVNSYNGVLFFGQTDMETQNTAMPMQLRFYYNSSSYATNYGYGKGFSLGYEMRYSVDERGNVTVTTGDGRSDTYKRYGTDYEAPAGVFGVLSKSSDGSYVLKEKDGTAYTFANAQHRRLTAVTDRNGNRTELTYTDSLLTQIRDAVGHTITLSYTDGLLTTASASFHQGSIRYEYNAKGCLRKRTDAMGNRTIYAYNDDNRLETITDANGHKTMIAYNSAGMCSRIKTEVSDKSIRYDGDKTVFIDYTDPKNQYSYYRWDGKGRVVEKVGLCCGIQSKLEYDDNDNVIRRTDANGNVTSYTYDNRGNMLSMTDALGNTERYTYDADFNQVTSFQDKNGNTYRFTYDQKGNLTSFSGPQGFSNSYTYNEKGWLLTTTDANSGVTANTYNADGTMQKVMNAAGYVTSYNYDQCGNITTVTDPRGNSTSYKYDNNNRIVSQSDALGNTTSVSYDKVGNIVRIMDTKNQITAYTYDAVGNMLTMVNPKGGIYRCTYDGKGQLLAVTNPEGETITQEWNEKGKLLSQTNGAGERTAYDYDAKGNLTSVFLPNGNVLNYFYDQVDRVIQFSDNIGTVAKYTYDANGNRLTAADGLGRMLTYTYDALNRCITEAMPSGATTAYTYDGNGNLLTITDAKGSVTSYSYSSLNQQLTHTDALNAKTQFEYDANGNLIKATDANGNATSYTYDALGRNTDIAFANGLSLQYTYDELGRVVASKDRAGQQFKYAYDQLGNLLAKSYPDGTTDSYSYDGIGRMLSAVNKAATVSFTYDHAGRLLSETLNGKTTGYAYDVAAGKRTLTYPSGMKVVEQLNARNLITSILQNGDEVVTMAYNATGQKTTQGYANGITTTYGYNENGWLSSIVADHDVMSLEMDYDAIGNITQRRDLLDEARTESYGYDFIGQLVSFKRGTAVDNSYQFDLLGNRVKVIENGIATDYASNNVNAYTSISGPKAFTPDYDENGNLLHDANGKYAYDYNNRLFLAGSTEYSYDALGRRIAKDNTLYYYVGDQMVEEVTGGETTSYLYGNDIDEALQMKKAGNVYYYSTNHLGSVMAVTDNNGSIVEQVDYDAYGLPTFLDAEGNALAQSAIGNNILFTGREYDAETGLYYYRARTMHPGIGRFMQKDPMGYIDGLNDYSYVLGNAIMYSDPYGLLTYKQLADYSNSDTNKIFTDGLDYSSNMMGGLEFGSNWTWATTSNSYGKVYTNGWQGNQYTKVGSVGKVAGKVGNALGLASTVLQAPGYYDRLSNAEDFQEFGEIGGGWLGGALGGMAAGAAAGALFGGVGAVPGAFIGLGAGILGAWGGQVGGSWIGGKLGKMADDKLFPTNECEQQQPELSNPIISPWVGDFEYSPGPRTYKSGFVYV